MRTIKFRGFSNGTWYYGDLEYNPSKKIARIHSYNENGEYLGQHIVDSETIGQFVGLCDKNGEGIYEGDIVRHKEGLKKDKSGNWVDDTEDITVTYSGASFSVCGLCMVENSLEIIGNIYEDGKETEIQATIHVF